MAIDLSSLFSDPEYRKLPYGDQQTVVANILRKKLAADPQFVALNPADKEATFNAIMKKNVSMLKPTVSQDVTLTPEMEASLLQNRGNAWVGSGISEYQKGMFILNEMDKGNPDATQWASGWIVGNNIRTSTLLGKVMMGAKDALETLFGKDQKMFDDLAFHVQDYSNISSAMLSRMHPRDAEVAQAKAQVTGTIAQMAEFATLDRMFVGTMASPGLFTSKAWNYVKNVQATLGTSFKDRLIYNTLPIFVKSVAGGGLTNLAVRMPDLIQEGLSGDTKQMFRDTAMVFGTGIAYDILFNTAAQAAKILKTTIHRGVVGFKVNNAKTMEDIVKVMKNGSSDDMMQTMMQLIDGKVPGEILQQLPEEYQKIALNNAARMQVLKSVKDFNPHSQGGFTILSKAMGFDVEFTPQGKIDIFSLDGKVLKTADSMVEAASFMQNMGFKNVDFGEIGGPARIKVYRPAAATLDDIPSSQWRGLIEPDFKTGQLDKKAVETVLRKVNPYIGDINFIDEDSFLSSFKDYTIKGNMTLPSTITKPQTRAFFDTLLERQGLPVSPLSQDVRALNAVFGVYGGGEVIEKGSNLVDIKFPDGRALNNISVDNANKIIWGHLIENDFIDDATALAAFKNTTGYSVDLTLTGDGVKLYVARDAFGKIVQESRSISELMQWAPFGGIKFPDTMMPDIILEGDKLMVGKTVISGPVESIMDYVNRNWTDSVDFKSVVPPGSEVSGTYRDGMKWKMTTNKRGGEILVEIPSTGFKKTFTNSKQARQFLTEAADKTTRLSLSAARKGYRLTFNENGLAVLKSPSKEIAFNSLEKLQNYMASIPDMTWRELTPFVDKEFSDELRATIEAQVLGEGGVSPFPYNKQFNYPFKPFLSDVEMIGRPTQGALDKLAQLLHQPEIANMGRRVTLHNKAAAADILKAKTALRAIFTGDNGKIVPEAVSELYQEMLFYKPEQWADVAKSMGKEWTSGDARRMWALRNFYDTTGQLFGINYIGFMENYGPRLRDLKNPEVLASIMKETEGAVDFAQKAFGTSYENMRELKFFAKNSRLDDVVNMFVERNALRSAEFYVEKGYRELHLGKLSKELKDFVESLKDKVTPSQYNSLLSLNGAILGGTVDRTGQELRTISLNLSKGISEAFSWASEKFGDTAVGRAFANRATKVITDDILNDLQQQVAASTLGFRPMRIIYNSSQFANTYAIFGSRALQAYTDLTDAELRVMFEKGIISEKVFSNITGEYQSVRKNLLDLAMRGQQNSEYLTRGATAKVTAQMFDEGLEKWQKGIVKDFKDFAKYTHYSSFMSKEALDSIEGLLGKGQLEAARDLAQTEAIGRLMFDYEYSMKSRMFRGTIGRLFGQFGTYSVNQIQLYNQMLHAPDMAQGLATFTRLVAITALLRNAFYAVGVDYNGFSILDPFRFHGGPLFTSIAQFFAGNTDQTTTVGKMTVNQLALNFGPLAKKNGQLTLNYPRLLAPFGLQVNSMIDAWDALSKGDGWGAFYNALGAHRSPGPWDHFILPF
jgi:hypothetical protein